MTDHRQNKVVVPTADEIRAWPATVSVPTAGRCYGLGRDTAYDLARRGEFPVAVLRIGRHLVVTRASIMSALNIADTDSIRPFTVHAPNRGKFSQVNGVASSLPSDAHGSTEVA